MQDEKLHLMYTDESEIDAFINVLNENEYLLRSFIYGSAGPSNHLEYEKLPERLKIIHSDALHDLKHLIATLNFLKDMRGY